MSRLRADNYTDQAGTGPPNFPNGISISGSLEPSSLNSSGIVTGSSFNSSGIITGSSFRGDGSLLTGVITSVDFISGIAATFTGDVSIGGALTYEDVSNVDAVGVVTAQVGVRILTGGVTVNAGVSTFAADISIADKIIHTGDTNTAIRFPAADTFTVETAGSERTRVDSSGRLLLGTSTSRSIGAGAGYPGKLQVESSGFTNTTFTQNSNDLYGPEINLGKSRGAVAGGTTVVQSGDQLGIIQFAGADGTDLETNAAAIECRVDGTPGSNDMPGRLVFYTTADGAALPTERLRITSGGFLGINDSSASRALAIKYNDDTVHSETSLGPELGAIRIFNQSTTTNATAGEIIFGAGDSGTGYATINGIRVGSQECELSFRVSDSSTLNEALRLDKSANATFAGTVSDSIGPLRRLGVNSQSGAYTLVVADAGKAVTQSTNSAAVTVPASIFTAGDMVTVINNTGTDINLTQGSGLTMYNSADAATGTRTLAQRGAATLLFISASVAYVSGSGLS